MMRLSAKILASVGVVGIVLAGGPATQVPVAMAAVQSPLLPDVADIVDKLLPAVVEISVQSKNPDAAEGASQPDSNPFKNFFDDFLKRKQGGNRDDKNAPKRGDNAPDARPSPDGKPLPDEKSLPDGKAAPDQNGMGDATPDLPDGGLNMVNSMGSGFIIDPKGLIVTNNHVIADAVNIQVHLQDGTLLKAELVGHDPKTDIAVIRVKPRHDLPSVSFGDSDSARVGQWVIAIGNPFGLGGSVSLGIVSAKARDINAGPYDNYIQTDAAINRGNSGGPLFDLSGNVIGINTAIFSPSGGSVGIGFSVPSNEARPVTQQLIKYGETRRGWLGVKLQTLTPDVAEGLGMDKPHGALVADVTEGGPSASGGMKPGDVIVGFDGHEVGDSKTLRRVVAETDVGKAVDVRVLRDGKEQALKITLGRLEEGEKLAAVSSAQTAPQAKVEILGMSLSDLTDDLRGTYKLDAKVKGAVVTAVADGSDAAGKGLGVGDVVLEAGGKPVTAASDVADAVTLAAKDSKNSVLMLVAHAGSASDTRFVALKLKP